VSETTEEQDHVDRWLTEWEIPGVDLEVEAIVNRIGGLDRRLHKLLEETLAEFGLSLGEWKVLNHLRSAGVPYRRSAGKLAARADLSSGAMTNRLDRLESAGLVRRLPDPGDRRGVLVELTDKGLKMWEEALRTGAAQEALVTAALTPEEKQQLNGLLRRLMLEFERREQQKPS
jgi:DNA-binding MarR family transcriptional regulator